MSERRHKDAFAPGEYVRDELSVRGWTQAHFARTIGCPVRVVNEIITAKRCITPDIAEPLAAALGTKARLWLDLEEAYRHSVGNGHMAPGSCKPGVLKKLRKRCK